jgi:O-antigen/teichoic acid export membrane protein
MEITRKKVVSNTLWSITANWAAQIIAMLVVPLFIKNIGEELYGIWILTYVILGYGVIFDFGFVQGLQKYVAEARVKKDHIQLSRVVMSGLGLLTVLGIFFGLVVILAAHPIVQFFKIDPEHELVATQLLQIAGFLSIFTWPLRIADVVLNAAFRLKELAFVNAARQVIHSIVLLAFVYFSFPIIMIKWITSSAFVLLYIPAVSMVFKYVPEIEWNWKHFSIAQIKKMASFSFGIFYLAVLALLSTKIDNVVLGKIIGMSAITIYVIVSKPYEIIRQLSSMAMQSLMPASFNILPKATPKEREALMINAVKYRALILAPISAIVIVMMPSFIHLWVGEKYAQYAIWGQLFVGVHFFMPLSSMSTVGRIAGVMKLVNTMLTLKVFTNVVFSIYLTHKIGLGGVIMGTFISNIIFGEIVFGRFICKKMDISWSHVFTSFFQPTVVSVAYMSLLLFLNTGHYATSWFSLIFIAMLSYGLLMAVICPLFLREESQALIGFLQKRMRLKPATR